MGLSNEERQFKFFNCLIGWRFSLQKLAKIVEDKKDIVEAWISELDLITGKEISKLEGSSLYWFCGPNEENYISLFAAKYHAKSKTKDETDELGFPKVGHYDSLFEYENKNCLVYFVQRLRGAGFEISDNVNILAHYWDMWKYVAAILYPALRYEDSLFDIEKLQCLIGKIANEKCLLFESWISGQLNSEFAQEENNLLCKFKLFNINFKKFEQSKTKNKRGKAYRKVYWETDFSNEIKEILTKIGKMSMGLVAKTLSNFDQEEFEKECKRNKTSKEVLKLDPFSPQIPTKEELEIIAETGFYEDEVEEAMFILNEEFGTWCGIWSQWLEYVKFQTKIELELQGA